MQFKRLLYLRNGPYKVNPNMYNLQEIGFCKQMAKRGINCDILYYSDENRDQCIYEENGYKVTVLWRKGIKVLRTGIYPSILNKNFFSKYDIVITTEFSQVMSYLVPKLANNVVLYSGPYYNLFKIKPLEKVYDRVFTKSINESIKHKFVKSKLAKEYLEKKGYDNVHVLGVGLDDSVFQVEPKITKEISDLLDIMKSNKVLLYVGTLDERKNIMFTLKVFEKLIKEIKDLKLVIIGKGKKEYIDNCFSKINKEALDNVIHVQSIPNSSLKLIYANAEVFILPSTLEIFGMVLLEAMYFGLPTVTSLHGGSTTLIEDKINGIVLDKFDVDKWAVEIKKILEDNEYRKTLANNAAKTIKDNYTWEKICDNFLNYLK